MRKSEFERIVDKTFWGLENKHDFKKTETSYHTGGVTVRFQNPTTEVILNYEIGAFPWVTIADINNPETDRSSLSRCWVAFTMSTDGQRDDGPRR